ncbi:hypothetical protein ABZ897_53765 [Nonomuraea sp. NPDC046802]|uniref:hypothetical protein n=1 Tax=Nonomuraea sp. NPDC046802 TaxID=3154919 RepID=UPI0033CC81C0
MATLRIAAEREGLDVGAFVATSAVAVAEQKLILLPSDRRQQVREFVTARVALDRISDNLDEIFEALDRGEETPDLKVVLQTVTKAVHRVELAADRVLRNPGE